MSDHLDINHIRVGERHRRDFGDMEALKASIKTIGLLAPVVVDADNNLVAGHRRLEACRDLGHPTVPVRRVRQITDAVTALIAERDENTCREPFKPSEAVALGLALEEMERPKAEERAAAGRSLGGQAKNGVVGDTGSPTTENRAKTRDVVGPAVGLSGATYQRAKGVVLAVDDPDPAVAEVAKLALLDMDATGNITSAFNKVKAARKPAPPKLVAADKSPGAMAAKIEKAMAMAAEGHTSHQIAKELGYKSTASFANFREEQGIEVPADAVVRNTHSHDSNRIVEETAITLEGLAMSIGLVEMSQLDPERAQQWATSFESSLRSLNRFHKHMKEMALVPQS